jgi:hypothetical protein
MHLSLNAPCDLARSTVRSGFKLPLTINDTELQALAKGIAISGVYPQNTASLLRDRQFILDSGTCSNHQSMTDGSREPR